MGTTSRPRRLAVLVFLFLTTIPLLAAPELAAADAVLENGDILVGDRQGSSFWGFYGVIWRIRDGDKQILLGEDPTNRVGFGPTDFLIDSKNRLVFVATSGHVTGNSNDTGLFRANLETGEIELLHTFRYHPGPDEPLPDAYPRGTISAYTCLTTGLHASRVLQVSIDDDVKDGVPQFRYAEAYNLSAALTVSGEPARVYAFRYLADEGRLERGISMAPLPPSACGFDMAISGSDTWFGKESWIGVAEADASLNLRINAETDIGSAVLTAALRMGGRTELVYDLHTILDDLDIENTSVKACGMTAEVPFNTGGTFHVLSGVKNIGFVGDGLYATSVSGAAGVPWLIDIGSPYTFINPYICLPYRAVTHKSPVEFFSPGWEATSTATRGDRILSTGALGLLSRLKDGSFDVLADGFMAPSGVAPYPPEPPPTTGAMLVVRIDSPIDVLLTDRSGRRIGKTATGDAVNDFAEKGAVIDPAGAGEPLFYAVMDPEPGTYSVSSVGTGNGPYTISVYSIHPSSEEAGVIQVKGTTTAGAEDSHDFTASDDLALTFVAPPLPDDTVPPVTTATLSTQPNAAGWHNADVTVTLSAVDEEGGSGVREILYSTHHGDAIAGDVVNGSAASISITEEGTTVLTFGARDVAGNEEPRQTLAIRIDRTPPTVHGTRSPEANDAGWNNTDVKVEFSCTDELSGIASCEPEVQLVVEEGTGQSRTAEAVDVAGNRATAVVAGINIDKTSPSFVCVAVPEMLWPPNHKLTAVTAELDLTDGLSGPAGHVLRATSSNEPDEGTGDGDEAHDIQDFEIGTPDLTGLLRAERAGTTKGRLYLLEYDGADLAGNTTTCRASVTVPHNQTR